MSTIRTMRGAILDIDGTLVNSNDYHAVAWLEALAEHGHRVGFERIRPLIGMGGDKVLPELIGIEKGTPEGRAISDRRGNIYQRRYLPRLRPCHGSRQLLEALRQRGIRLAVASSAQVSELEPMLRIAGATDLLQSQTSADDAEESKPDPDIIAAALQQLGEPAESVLMLGDTPYDIEAARRLGVGTVILRSGGWWRDDEFGGALAIHDDPADLLAHLDGSPFAR